MKKIVIGIFIFSISVLLVLFNGSTVAAPDESGDCNSCHDEEDYEISADKTTINAQTSTKITITIKASGDDLIVEAPEDARDNDKFDFDDDLIEDNDANDDDSDNDEIEVEIEITTPNKEGEYTLLIISRASEDSGGDTPLKELEIEVNVGEERMTLETFLDPNNYYLGGLALIFMFIGLIVFQINMNKLPEGLDLAIREEKSTDIKKEMDVEWFKDKLRFKMKGDIYLTESADFQDVRKEVLESIETYLEGLDFGDDVEYSRIYNIIMNHKQVSKLEDLYLKIKDVSKTHGFFIAIALILITVNIFLIMNATMDFTLGLFESMESRELLDLANLQDLSQVINIILGSIGYIAGIIVVFGTFTNVPGHKLKLPKYIMLLGWTFNFLYGIFIISPILI